MQMWALYIFIFGVAPVITLIFTRRWLARKSKKEKIVLNIIAGFFLTFLFVALWRYPSPSPFIRDLAREGKTKAHIGALRQGIKMYYDEVKEWPRRLNEENKVIPKYLLKIPPALLRLEVKNNESNKVTYGTIDDLDSSGGWLYDSTTGKIWINHTANDSKGVPYSSY
jgi:hypothetical protein